MVTNESESPRRLVDVLPPLNDASARRLVALLGLADHPKGITLVETYGDVVSAPETADAILAHLVQMDPAGPWEIGTQSLAESLGVSQSTVVRGLRRLRGDGRIVVLRRGSGLGHPSRYGLP